MRDGGAYGCAVPRAYANLNPGLISGLVVGEKIIQIIKLKSIKL